MILEEGTKRQFKDSVLNNVEHRVCARGHVLVADHDEIRHVADIIEMDCAECFITWNLTPLATMNTLNRLSKLKGESGARNWFVTNF